MVTNNFTKSTPQKANNLRSGSPYRTPEFDTYPWQGLIRVLYLAYRNNWESLATQTLEQFKQQAKQDLIPLKGDRLEMLIAENKRIRDALEAAIKDGERQLTRIRSEINYWESLEGGSDEQQ